MDQFFCDKRKFKSVKIRCARAHLEKLSLALAIFQAQERALALTAKERRSNFALF